jgi:MYND finger
LNLGCVGASLDYSLMLMLREWYRPWSPETHASFPPEFRSAVKTMLLASHRVSLPAEVTHRVLEFLHRDWWPDSRRQCWNFDCQAESTQSYYNAERDARPAVPARFLTTNDFVRCHHCQIATYCSEACRSSDWKSFHKSHCNRPPCRIPGPDEETFIASLEEPGDSQPNEGTNDTRGALSEAVPRQEAQIDETSEIVVEDDGDDEWEDEESENEEWEDMETDDDENGNGEDLSRAQRIYRYFRDRSYRYQE